MEESNAIELGGSIEPVGFREMDGGTMVIVKKIVGNFVKKIADANDKFEHFTLSVKNVHETKGSTKYELQGKLLIAGKPINSEVTDRNLFFTLNTLLNKLESLALK